MKTLSFEELVEKTFVGKKLKEVNGEPYNKTINTFEIYSPGYYGKFNIIISFVEGDRISVSETDQLTIS